MADQETTIVADGGGDQITTLQAQLATLLSEREADKTAATTAAEVARVAAETERASKLTADQKLHEEIAKQRGELDTTRQQLATDRRNLALDRLGVAEKFRNFAPAVDPGDVKGAKALEDWARLNPELLRPQHQQMTPANLALEALKSKAGAGLRAVLDGTRRSTLVTERNLSKLR